jgi:hypothetical protein
MLVYRDEEQIVDARATWSSLARHADALGTNPAHDGIVALAIDLGEFEAGVADCLFPDRDGLDVVTDALRAATVAAGDLLIASWTDRNAVPAQVGRCIRALAAVPAADLPRTIVVRPSEGYAFYALHPEGYASAAATFLVASRPRKAVVVGIRGIGTSLSGVVAAQAGKLGIDTASFTVRPHAHPFDRRVSLRDDLASYVRGQPKGAAFLIVDEGPGLSGSSFAAAVRALTDSGIEPDRIVLFPSWNPDGSQFKSESARQIWNRHVRCPADPSIGEAYLRTDVDPLSIVDVSAGAWRQHWCASDAQWPAVHPQHERRKLWARSEGHVTRFAGLGRYGAARLQRAEALAAAAIGARPMRLQNGYLRLRFVGGRPCTIEDGANPRLLERLGGHIGFLARHFPSSARVPLDAIEHMIETNVRLALGSEWLAATQPAKQLRSAVADAPAVEIDGRMLPHEWIRTDGDFCKVDALDHHADHFFPGAQDAGWDLAAACIEFQLTNGAANRLVAEYVRSSGDRDVAVRLPWHRLAYLAFRIGYASLAADALGDSPDASRFRRLGSQYRALLRRELALIPGFR